MHCSTGPQQNVHNDYCACRVKAVGGGGIHTVLLNRGPVRSKSGPDQMEYYIGLFHAMMGPFTPVNPPGRRVPGWSASPAFFRVLMLLLAAQCSEVRLRPSLHAASIRKYISDARCLRYDAKSSCCSYFIFLQYHDKL